MTTDDHVELVTAILDGHIPGGSPLPSGRKLAQQLGVSRNTVVLAYQHLVDEGYLVSRERSGHYVNQVIAIWACRKSTGKNHGADRSARVGRSHRRAAIGAAQHHQTQGLG